MVRENDRCEHVQANGLKEERKMYIKKERERKKTDRPSGIKRECILRTWKRLELYSGAIGAGFVKRNYKYTVYFPTKKNIPVLFFIWTPSVLGKDKGFVLS
jgi:hypothetical protein